MHNKFWNIPFSHMIQENIFKFYTEGEYEIVMFYKKLNVHMSPFRINQEMFVISNKLSFSNVAL